MHANDDKYADAQNKVTAEFEHNDESIEESIGAYASAEELAAQVAGYAAIIRECGELVVEVQGRKFNGRVGETSFPKLGDETLGYTVTFEIEGFEVFLNKVLVRRGGLLLQFFGSAYLSNDTYQLVKTMKKAIAKVDRVVPD